MSPSRFVMSQTDRSVPSKPPLPATPFTKGMEARVLRYVRGRRAIRAGERVLVAVSGGQDSLTLLLLLHRLAEELEIELMVAHFDHRLRSRDEAAGDEAVSRRLAEALGLSFVRGSGDVRARARRRHESIEEAARHLRFGFLRREVRQLRADVVALGHTRDDRAETVMLHLLRGSGLDGIVGLRARSSWPFGRGPALSRPLLEVTRGDTLRYCREAGMEPREDPTNLQLDATRNRVRHEALPALRGFNPRLDEALCRLGEAAAGAVDYLDAAADVEWRALASIDRESVGFTRRKFASLAPALRARLLRRAVRHVAGAGAELEAVHVAAMEETLTKRRGSVALPRGLTASVSTRDVRIVRARATPARKITETRIAIPGHTVLPGWTIVADVVVPPPGKPRPRTRFEAWLDADAIGERVTVRSRRRGDRIRALGLGGTKKLQDLLVDAKVPEEERDAVPLVCGSWGVAWVVGHRMDERASLRDGSKRAVRIRFRRTGENR